MGREVPKLKTDADAERFLAQDLSDLDFSHFKPVTFELEPKNERIAMRLPAAVLRALRQTLERALTKRAS
ncbi:putative DNA binding protein, CopG/RHH family (fragment) [Beijerinckiaceae bacterium RH AL1]